ncbi:unnamed protein product [Rotaria sordida]|uniref:YTH domain-containing protein n=1 Tax=Rotaria sordida TaxID=392033 RepID=A0A818JYQ0_9BILA|nr:unnamed protein product [Rotaria sordida]CAF3548565.1 unnamed protein product [Rotaria sordida]
MINERSSAQANTPTSANMQYGYPTNHYDMMNIQPMQNPNDLYSYYPPSLYQPFGTFDDHSQWGSADTSGNVPPQPGPMQFHPQLYTPSPLEIPRNPFDYPQPHHAYTHYHPGFTPSTFPGPPSTGTSAFDMSWNPHNISMQQMQVAAQQQMTPIGGGLTSNKKTSVYDEYPASGVGDMLAQHMNAVDLGSSTNNDDTHNYDNGTNDSTQNINVLSSKEQQQHYQTNSSNLSLSSRSSQVPSSSTSSGPKSYASVVSSDTINTNNNKSIPSVPNIPSRSTVQSSTNERINTTSNFSNDSTNSRTNTNIRGNNNNNMTNNYSQQTRNGTGGYNSRNQQQQSSASGGFLNWTNNSLPSNSRGNNTNNNNTSSNYYNSGSSNYYDRSSYSQQQQQTSTSSNNNNNKRSNLNYQQNYSSSRTTNNMINGSDATSPIGQQPISAANQEILDALKRNHQYNPKDFNLNPKGARFFVIKSYSEDDVHRSIKYNIWCSTEHGNKRLDAAFREREGKGPIYLFFSVNASGHFCGMAEMMSPVDYEHKTDVWQMSNKWQGKFEVKWIYVKDVPNQQFRNIRLENNDNKPVTNSRDTQEIPYEKGKLMLKTMHMYRDKTSIFDDFQYYESKQAEETTTKKPSNNDFMNTNARGNTNNNKRQYSSNKTSTMSSDQQQHQNENMNNEDKN